VIFWVPTTDGCSPALTTAKRPLISDGITVAEGLRLEVVVEDAVIGEFTNAFGLWS